jgi:hypothetical protein
MDARLAILTLGIALGCGGRARVADAPAPPAGASPVCVPGAFVEGQLSAQAGAIMFAPDRAGADTPPVLITALPGGLESLIPSADGARALRTSRAGPWSLLAIDARSLRAETLYQANHRGVTIGALGGDVLALEVVDAEHVRIVAFATAHGPRFSAPFAAPKQLNEYGLFAPFGRDAVAVRCRDALCIARVSNSVVHLERVPIEATTLGSADGVLWIEHPDKSCSRVVDPSPSAWSSLSHGPCPEMWPHAQVRRGALVDGSDVMAVHATVPECGVHRRIRLDSATRSAAATGTEVVVRGVDFADAGIVIDAELAAEELSVSLVHVFSPGEESVAFVLAMPADGVTSSPVEGARRRRLRLRAPFAWEPWPSCFQGVVRLHAFGPVGTRSGSVELELGKCE